jgi:hypothetical protein
MFDAAGRRCAEMVMRRAPIPCFAVPANALNERGLTRCASAAANENDGDLHQTQQNEGAIKLSDDVVPTPATDHEDDTRWLPPWDHVLREAVFKAWADEFRQSTWADEYGHLPVNVQIPADAKGPFVEWLRKQQIDPAQSHKNELTRRRCELDWIFNWVLKGKPLISFSAEQLNFLRHMLEAWSELRHAGDPEPNGYPPPPWHALVPERLKPPPPDAEPDPELKAWAAEGYPEEPPLSREERDQLVEEEDLD